MRRALRTSVLLAALAASLPLAACSDSSGDPVAPTPATPVDATTFSTSLGVNLASSTRLPSGVYIRELVVGTGPVVSPGQQLSMRYTGWLANGTQFDSNVGAATPFRFTLGAAQVIEGWDLGIVGMRVGGQRQLVIPSALGYGVRGSPPRIPSNAVLVFNVEVVAAQ